MYVLITYDVATSDSAGEKRLRRVARICLNYGQRVQNSVFECLVDPAQMVTLEHLLQEVIDPEKDSIRFYALGKTIDSISRSWGVLLHMILRKNLSSKG